MDSSATPEIMVIVVGATLTLLIWGAVGWWTIAERPSTGRPPLEPKRRDEPVGFDDDSELR